MNDLNNLLSPQILNQLGKQLGYSNSIPPQFVETASTLLLSGLSRNASLPNGINSLFNALQKDHVSGSNQLLNNLSTMIPGLLGNNRNAGILNHILGDKLDGIIDVFSQATGLPRDRARKLLMIIAPIVLAYFAKKMSQQNLTQQQMAKEIRKTYRDPNYGTRSKDDGGLLEKILDNNGNGNYLDEAFGLLKNLILK